MQTLKFKEYRSLNEDLNQGFLEPTKENIHSFGLDYSLVSHNQDGSIDYNINGKQNDVNIDLSEKNLKRIPFKFRIVNCDFHCSKNNITSLEGSPEYVNGWFFCDNNKLTSLKYSPKIVKKCFVCDNNKLTSLKYAPDETGCFDCTNNLLVTLDCPHLIINESFNCSNNKLSSLKNGPKIVKEDIKCDDNNIIILDGYGKSHKFDWVDNNPILVNRTNKRPNVNWRNLEIRKKFQNGLHYLDKDEFINVLISIKRRSTRSKEVYSLLTDYYVDILNLAKKLNVDLKSKTPKNWYDIYSKKIKELDDFGLNF